MKKGKLFLGYVAIAIAAIVLLAGMTAITENNNSSLNVKAISVSEAPNETALFWHNASYLGAWALKLLALGALVYLSLIGWEIQCVRWNAKKK